MVVYLTLIFAIIFMLLVKNKLNSKFNRLVFLILCSAIIIIVGFRNVSVGSDSLQYKKIFEDTAKESFIEIMLDGTRLEKGFLIQA